MQRHMRHPCIQASAVLSALEFQDKGVQEIFSAMTAMQPAAKQGPCRLILQYLRRHSKHCYGGLGSSTLCSVASADA